MKILCPQHRNELKIVKEELILQGKSYAITAGHCPECKKRYINREMFHNLASFSVSDVTYEYMHELNVRFPVDYAEDDRLREEKIKKKQEAENLRRKLLAEQYNKQVTEKLRQEREAERAREKEEQKRQEEIGARYREIWLREKQKREEEERIWRQHLWQKKSELREELLKNPSKLYRPSFISYCKKIPAKCPKDSMELVFLRNVQGKNLRKREAYCCIFCSRVFLLENEAEKLKAAPKKQEKKVESGVVKKVAQAQNNTPTKQIKSTNVIPSVERTSKEKNLIQKKQEKAENTQGIKTTAQPKGRKRLPASVILTASVRIVGENAEWDIVVVSDIRDQNSSKGIYWAGRAVSSMVMAAVCISTNPEFEYRKKVHRVASFELFENAEKYLRNISRFLNPERPQTVYVFAHKMIPRFQSQEYEMVYAMVPCANGKYPEAIPVYYEKETNRYFINEETYQEVRKECGLPYMRLRPAQSESRESGFGGLREQSDLKFYGYSVGGNGLTMQARRRLLRDLIDTGILNKAVILEHLEWLIHTRKNNPSMWNAVGEWEADRKYVQVYQKDTQREIWVLGFQSRYSGFYKL